MNPPSEDEIAEYGRWLGLESDDSDLLWIAKQALQTHIPPPWIECETEDGDIFYFNANTKESVWDHPYDSFYKAAIAKFKSKSCTREELVAMVSQEWLLSGTDKRASSTEIPGIPAGDSPLAMTGNPSPTAGMKSFRLVAVASNQDESPKPMASVNSSMEADYSSPTSSLMFMPSGGVSPGRNRRRSTRTSPKGSIFRPSEETNLETQEKLKQVTSELESERKRFKAESTALTADLIKAREYIDLLLAENRSLRSRMADAAARVQVIQKDASGIQIQLSAEQKKREAAEAQARYLEDRVRALESDSPSPRRSSHIFSRLCGGGPAGEVSKRALVKSVSDEHKNASKSAPTTPRVDPYTELFSLLASAPATPGSVKK